MPSPDVVRADDHPSDPRAVRADALALMSLPAIAIAYVSMFPVLGSSDYASRFENGVLPPNVDPSSGQGAAVVSVACAVLAVVLIASALASRVTKTSGTVAVLGILAAVPYAPLGLLTWGLAF